MPLVLDISRLRSLIPCIGKLHITITVFSGDFFIAKFYALKMIMLLFGRIFSVVHHWRNADNFHTLKQNIEVFRFLSRVINFVPFELSRFKRLTSSNGFI